MTRLIALLHPLDRIAQECLCIGRFLMHASPTASWLVKPTYPPPPCDPCVHYITPCMPRTRGMLLHLSRGNQLDHLDRYHCMRPQVNLPAFCATATGTAGRSLCV